MTTKSVSDAARWLTAALAATLLAACAAPTQVDAQWLDPQFKGRGFAGQRWLVVCGAGENTLARVCEDQLASEVAALGGSVVRMPKEARATTDAGATLATARRAGAVAVLKGVVSTAAQSYNPGPQFSIGVGGFGGGSTSVGGGVGVTLPAGAGSVSTGHAIELGIVDVASGQLIWSTRATAAPSADVGGQVADLARSAVAAAHGAGLL